MKPLDDIKQKLVKSGGTKLFRYISGWFGAGLYLSGVFISHGKQLQESDANKLLLEFIETATHYGDKPYMESNKVFVKDGKGGTAEVVAGYMTFDTSGPAAVNILESSGCSSLTDNGTADYSVNFTEPLGSYIYSFITSEPVQLINVSMGDSMLRMKFNRRFSGIVKIIFFEQVLTYS